MTTVRAIVRNGQLELESSLDLPDGTVLIIPVPGVTPEDLERSQKGIDEWEKWYKELEPMLMTAEERAAWDKAREEDKQLELSQWESRSRMLENLFP